jgi:glucose-1-phosphate thymidylyltransferase
MRPQTWSKPKPLVSVAGRTAMEHLLASFDSLPGVNECELVIIYSPGLGETQLPPYMAEHYPGRKVHYVLQANMQGQSHALWLAREHLKGPIITCFSDTLIEADFSFLADEKPEGIAWVKPVPDPRRFGVAEVDVEGWVTRLVEKPTELENNRVVVGCYYFRDGEQLLAAVQEQIKRGNTIKGEYFLTEGINIMLERGLKMRTEVVKEWLDTGTIAATLETNRILLGQAGMALPLQWTPERCLQQGVTIIPPVFIHETAVIHNTTIGPNASIGEGCQINEARVEDSILEMGVSVESASLTGSFVGRRAKVVGRSVDAMPLRLNIGDDSSVLLK